MVNRLKLFSFKGLKYSINTILMALIPVMLAILLLQFFVNIRQYDKAVREIELKESYNIEMLIYYIVSGLVHIIICAIIANQFALTNKKDITELKLKITRNTRLIFLLFVFFLVYFLDYIHTNLAYLSHDRLYILMSKSEFYRTSFASFPRGAQWFHLFSSFPFILICFALAVMIYAGFYIGNEMYNFVYKQDFSVENLKEYIKDLHQLLRNYAQLLSIVMVSSTIATILFFQLPVPLIKDELIKGHYSNVSMAMGICWGVVFSLTLLFLCIYPYKLAHKKISSIVQMERIKNDPALEEWIDKHKSYYTFIWNLRLFTSIISPAAAGILTTIISHVL